MTHCIQTYQKLGKWYSNAWSWKPVANSIIMSAPLHMALKPSPTWGHLSSLLSQIIYPAIPRMPRRTETLMSRDQKKLERPMDSKFKSNILSFV